jgi:hypothetical protein
MSNVFVIGHRSGNDADGGGTVRQQQISKAVRENAKQKERSGH